MREIKFRCWFDNQMHKVEDISFKGKTINLFAADIIKFENGILMQYTGLHDKNGKEIYEGDIVKSYYYIYTPNGEQERFNQKVINYNDVLCEYNINAFDNLEVIGNIYENPELLEE